MNLFDRAVAAVNPRAGLRRAQARLSLQALAHYRAASVPRRSASVRAAAGDADAVAMMDRRKVTLAARDVLRNNATAARGVQVLVNAMVGTGIEPKLVSEDAGLQAEFPRMKRLLDSVEIDADGVSTLAGIQRLMVQAMVVDGESLLLWPREPGPRGHFQLRVLEADYLDDRMQGRAENPANSIYDGIEYAPDGRVVAYYLYDEHPGSVVWHPDWRGLCSRRVEADRVIHLYRVDRPGQRRGISWLAPVLEDLVALADNDEAQLLRQKIAACFAAFWKSDKTPEAAAIPTRLAPGLIQQIGTDDEVAFGTPPDVTGYDDFAKLHLRRIASGLGITYEALTGDLTGVNYSSGRLGRIEMAQNVEGWQWAMVIPRLCDPLGAWFLRAWAYADPGRISALSAARLDYTPPPPVVADPNTEIGVAVQKIEAGLSSRHSEIRKLGYDPGAIDAEIARDVDLRRTLASLKAPAQTVSVLSTKDQKSEVANGGNLS